MARISAEGMRNAWRRLLVGKAPRPRQRARRAAGELGVLGERLAERVGEALAGQVVVGRAEATGGDDKVHLGARGGEGGGDHGPVIGERPDPAQLHPQPRQLGAQVRGVGVDRLAEQDLACRC